MRSKNVSSNNNKKNRNNNHNNNSNNQKEAEEMIVVQQRQEFKFKISYYDNEDKFQQKVVVATSSRDALVNTWLNDVTVIYPVGVQRVS